MPLGPISTSIAKAGTALRRVTAATIPVITFFIALLLRVATKIQGDAGLTRSAGGSVTLTRDGRRPFAFRRHGHDGSIVSSASVRRWTRVAGTYSSRTTNMMWGPAGARAQQHCHDQHLHSPDRADPRFAQKPPRQGDERPLIAVSRRDRACRRLPPVRGRLSVGPWHGDASLASPCHRRHPGLPDRGPRRTPVALRSMQPRGVLLSLLQKPILSEMPHQAGQGLARCPQGRDAADRLLPRHHHGTARAASAPARPTSVTATPY